MSALTVAVVFGGRSSEHSISCISAAAVWEAIEGAGHRVVPIAVTRSAGMFAFDGSPDELRSETLPVLDGGDRPVSIAIDPSVHGIVIDGQVTHIDVVFPVLHGPWGEDGTIQGLLELAGIPYVGSGVLASALCMDKLTLKTVLSAAGVAVAPWVAVDAYSWPEHRDRVIADAVRLGPTVFVKPSRAGSSLGISRVETADVASLVAAIDSAREHDPRVVIEQAILGAQEIECGVRQLADGRVESTRLAQIVVREEFDFYDFDAKYLADGAELLVPAPVSHELHERLGAIARDCFRRVGCEGLARVDFFVTGDHVVVNELNTMPGFTPISMFPRMWQDAGVDYPDLIDSLVHEAYSRPSGLR